MSALPRYAQLGPDRQVIRVVVCDDPQWLADTIGGTWVLTGPTTETEQGAGPGAYDASGIAPMRFVMPGQPGPDDNYTVDILPSSGNAAVLYATPQGWWGSHVAALPDTGTIEAGSMYVYDGTLYKVLVTHSRDQWGGDPAQWPTYIRRIRKPGEVAEWEPVIDRYDSYWLVNPFTGEPDEALHHGEHYVVTAGNAEGGNTWPPSGEGSFGWALKNPGEWPPFVQPMAGDPGYMTGDKVTFDEKRYVCNRDGVMHSPAAWPEAWDEQP